MDPIDKALDEIEELLRQAKSPEVKESLRRTQLELLKKKFEASETEKEQGEQEARVGAAAAEAASQITCR
jgi:hypothetical protein